MGFDGLSSRVQVGLKKIASELSVIVADDDMRYRSEFVDRLMEVLKFKKIVQAPDGKQALNLLTKQEFDIILTDFDMPKICGTDLVRRCTEHCLSSKIDPPVVIIISRYDDSAAIKEMLSGVQLQFISKETVYRLLGFYPRSYNGSREILSEREESRFWNSLFQAMQWALDKKKYK